ncbi:uncharacterized protein HaLaN_15950 [Haematococcus lacustris]|uniref:ANK_REP_REGION domain-containing protein n=1 Tax=Haematococcus lacustris TaxID=44745 RepID=A0A699ZSZ0_HAELA|nr:uncharacterized protein HaLaN_15950 [Haematococcus lacustris]
MFAPDIPIYLEGQFEPLVADTAGRFSPLHLAMVIKRYDMARLLLDLQASPNVHGWGYEKKSPYDRREDFLKAFAKERGEGGKVRMRVQPQLCPKPSATIMFCDDATWSHTDSDESCLLAQGDVALATRDKWQADEEAAATAWVAKQTKAKKDQLQALALKGAEFAAKKMVASVASLPISRIIQEVDLILGCRLSTLPAVMGKQTSCCYCWIEVLPQMAGSQLACAVTLL